MDVTKTTGADALDRAQVTGLNITVLMGGPSSEKAVSLETGQAVADALARRGHHVTTADISPTDTRALDGGKIDVVFIALHGAFGEDGQVQRLCEQRGLLYVGSGPAASALAMDKSASKRRFREANLTTADWIVVERSTDPERLATMLEEVPPPCVVKPIDHGSSVGVSMCEDEASRHAAMTALLAEYGRCMIEQFIPGREMTVGVLGDLPLPVIEIKPAGAFYDYHSKYKDGRTKYHMDKLTPALEQHLRGAALVAHRALGCRDLSRTDFIVTDAGVANVLEVNTIPGFTSHSLMPKAAAAAGIGFDDLCQRLVVMALGRGRR